MSERFTSVTKNNFLGMANVKQKVRQESISISTTQVKVKVSNPQIMDVFYRKYYNTLCGYIRRRFGNGPPDPEDVAQATFERILGMEGLEDIHNPRGFLFTIAGRIFIDKIRRRAVSDNYIDQQFNLLGAAVEEITPERVYRVREDFKAILNDLHNFSPIHREVVLRHRVLGQTYDEISCATELSPASISRYLKAAMKVVFKTAGHNNDEKGE